MDEQQDLLNWLKTEPWAEAYLELWEPGALKDLRGGRWTLAPGESKRMQAYLLDLKESRHSLEPSEPRVADPA